jgi:hypothetical protein
VRQLTGLRGQVEDAIVVPNHDRVHQTHIWPLAGHDDGGDSEMLMGNPQHFTLRLRMNDDVHCNI